MPCYNPVKEWEVNVVNCFTSIQQSMPHVLWHLIIVNDGSSKNVENKEIRYLKEHIPTLVFIDNNENKGKGYAIKCGIEKCTTDYAIYTDIDFPYLETDLANMYHYLIDKQADIVIGIRNESYYKDIPTARKNISKWYKQILKLILRIPTTDTQAGLKALSKKGVAEVLQCKTNTYLFDLELIKRCAINKLTIEQIPIHLKQGIVLSKMPIKILMKEFYNFVKILFL